MTHRLPAHYRDAISFVELEGLTQREAAERFGLSVSGMKSRVQRGRQMLKRMLDGAARSILARMGALPTMNVRIPHVVIVWRNPTSEVHNHLLSTNLVSKV
jgi:RNA polymerase sigma-70 factor, ECF subfamily